MKKLALLSVAAAVLATPAFAADDMKAAPAATPTAAPAASTTGASAAAAAVSKKVELKDGSWAEVAADGTAKVSKDGGKTWEPAKAGTVLEPKEGASIVVK